MQISSLYPQQVAFSWVSISIINVLHVEAFLKDLICNSKTSRGINIFMIPYNIFMTPFMIAHQLYTK